MGFLYDAGMRGILALEHLRMLIDKIHSPAELKSLKKSELSQLAAELRAIVLDTASKNGGHLASNFGSTELTIALHYVFDTPRDKIV